MRLAAKIKSIAKSVGDQVRLPFRAVLSATQSGQKIQSMQINGLDGETVQDAEFYQQFGITSHPPAGTRLIVLPLGGNTSHGVIIATENGAYRVQSLKSGEVCIYDTSGSTITLKNNKIIDIKCDYLNIECKKYTCKTDTLAIDATQTIKINAAQTVDMIASGAMNLGGTPSITLNTPMTILSGGLTAGSGSSMSRSASNYTATFNIPVTFIKPQAFNARATFNVPLYAVDAVINGVLHKDHVHLENGDKTKKPQNP